jgi:hypothetical protein
MGLIGALGMGGPQPGTPGAGTKSHPIRRGSSLG